MKAGNRIDDVMHDVAQVIHSRGGAQRDYAPPGATAFYAGDGHDHWHISTFIIIALFPTDGAGSTVQASPTYNQRGLRKIGFCLTDLVRAPAALRPSNSASRIGFPVSGCGVVTSQQVRMGISVGFGDDYKPFFNHQSVDITGLPSGTYRLCATVNPNGVWLEKDDRPRQQQLVGRHRPRQRSASLPRRRHRRQRLRQARADGLRHRRLSARLPRPSDRLLLPDGLAFRQRHPEAAPGRTTLGRSSFAPIRLRLAMAIALAAAAHASLRTADGQRCRDRAAARPAHGRAVRPAGHANTSGGFYKLRFGTIIWNVGDGPLEVRATARVGQRDDRGCPDRPPVQRHDAVVRPSNGSSSTRATATTTGMSASFVVVKLGPMPGSPPDRPAGRSPAAQDRLLPDRLAPRAGRRAAAAELAVARTSTATWAAAIATASRSRWVSRSATATYYEPFFAHQAIDITNVPTGTYRLCATVNPEMIWREKAANATNNSYWFDIALDPVARTVSRHRRRPVRVRHAATAAAHLAR